ncbi:MAG TPA: DoxX family protein [Acidobacteriaceae bacterium]|nr:DoxX family protein [Acidobacteriaceae bacterium]
MSRWLNRFQPWGLLILRVALGASMFYHGWLKVAPSGVLHGHPFAGLQRSAHFVAALGLPGWLGYVSALTEFLGGFCLLIGLLTRLFGFLVSINMLVAIFAVTIHRGYSTSELPIALFSMALMVLFAGPGKLAADRRLGLS